MGPFAQLVAAEAEVPVVTTGFAGGPTAVAHPHRSTVTGQSLDLAVDFQPLILIPLKIILQTIRMTSRIAHKLIPRLQMVFISSVALLVCN